MFCAATTANAGYWHGYEKLQKNNVVAGSSASGKSTLVKALVTNKQTTAKHGLDYYFYFRINPEKHVSLKLKHVEGPEALDFDSYYADLQSVKQKNAYHVLLAEGFLLLHDMNMCNKIYDVMFFLQSDRETANQRRKLRTEAFGGKWDQQYFDDQICNYYVNTC